jgi:cytochrome c-type biogenesis protein CcmH
MIGFVAIATALTVLVAAIILWPLLRGAETPRARIAASVVFVLLAGGAAALYARWSNYAFDAPVEANTPAEMVAKLARRLEQQPDDVAGWLMLGRSYAALGQFPLAQRAYQRADRLESGRNAEALAGWAEALVLQADGKIDERAGRMFEQALALQPDSEKALFYGAIVAQRRGDNAVAATRFEKLLTFDPPAGRPSDHRATDRAVERTRQCASGRGGRRGEGADCRDGERRAQGACGGAHRAGAGQRFTGGCGAVRVRAHAGSSRATARGEAAGGTFADRGRTHACRCDDAGT